MSPITVSTLSLSHMPEQPVYASLFRNVRNAPQLLAQVKAAAAKPTVSGGVEDGAAVSKEAEEKATQRADLDYAFLDASAILSTTHLLAAVFRALSDKRNNRDKTKNAPVHPEIVFCLGPNNNIAYAFEKFGIGEATTNVLVLKVPPVGSTITPETVSDHLALHVKVQGDSVPFNDATLLDCTDVGHIKEIYKLNDKSEPGKAERPVKHAKADKKAEKQARRKRDKDEGANEVPRTEEREAATAPKVENNQPESDVLKEVRGTKETIPKDTENPELREAKTVDVEAKSLDIKRIEIVVLGIMALRGS